VRKTIRAPVGEAITWSQLCILEAISKGYHNESHLRRTLNASKVTIQREIKELESMGLIEKEGFPRRRYKLTSNGINSLVANGRISPIVPASKIGQIDKKEVKVTSTLGTGFKLALGVIMGIFTAWLVIGVVASLVYWLTYQLLIKSYIPSTFLPYIPLENPWVDVLLGLATATALFLPLRRKITFGKG
jgi:predicted transcriptional regulator